MNFILTVFYLHKYIFPFNFIFNHLVENKIEWNRFKSLEEAMKNITRQLEILPQDGLQECPDDL